MDKPFVGAQLNPMHPLARGLVGFWVMNEGTGDQVWDYSGWQRTGTLTSMDPATDWVSSEMGYALDFDGSDDHVRCGANVVTGYPYTIWGICNPDTAGERTIICLSDFSVLTAYVFIRYSNALGAYNFSRRNLGSPSDCTGGSANGKMQMVIAVARSATDVELYVDGVSVATDTTSRVFTAGIDQTNIGVLARSGAYATNLFKGQLAATGVYDRALSVAEVASLTESSFQMIAPQFNEALFGALGPTNVGFESLLAPYLGVMGVTTAAAATAKILMRFGGGHGWIRGSGMDS